MIEVYEIPGEEYGEDLVRVVRCEKCVNSADIGVRFCYCTKTASFKPKNGYYDEGRENVKVR